jgi:hypothetical protein
MLSGYLPTPATSKGRKSRARCLYLCAIQNPENSAHVLREELAVETVLQFVQLIALVSLTALSIYLIVILSGLRRDVTEFVQRAKPVLDNLAYITEKLKSTAEKIDNHVDIVKSSLNSLKSVADNVLVLEERVQQRLEEPILQVASILGAIVSSIGMFFDRFRPRG